MLYWLKEAYMKIMKTGLSVLLALGVSFVLSAAGGDEEGYEAEKPVTLRMIKMDDPLEAMAFEKIVRDFQRIENGRWAYVNVEFDVKPFAELFPSITRAVATRADYDLAQIDGPNVRHFAFNGVTTDLTDYFTEEELAQWAPQSVAEGSYGDRFYGPPMVQSAQVLWYNVDMMREAGIDVSGEAAWRWGPRGSALENFRRLTVDKDGDGSPEVFGLNTEGPWDYFYGYIGRSVGEPGSDAFMAVGEDGVTFDGYFNAPEAVTGYQNYHDLVHVHRVMSSQRIQHQMFQERSATHIYQDMLIGIQRDLYPDFEMDVMKPPYYNTPITHTGSWHYGILSTTENFDEALAFVKFASSDVGARYIWEHKQQLPANVGLFATIGEFQDPDNPRRVVLDVLEEAGVPRISTPAYTEYNALFSEFWSSLMAGTDDVQALADQYAAEMTAAAVRYKGWQDE